MCGVVDQEGDTIDFQLRKKGRTLQGEKAIKNKLS